MGRGGWGTYQAILLAAGLLITAVGASAAAAVADPDTLVWRGEIHLDGPTRIPAGTVLALEPGTRVLPDPAPPSNGSGPTPSLIVDGDLRALGAPDHRIEFHVPVAVRGDAPGPTIIEWTTFEPRTPNATCALELDTSNASVSHARFSSDRDGLCIQPNPAGGARGSLQDQRTASGLEPATPSAHEVGLEEPRVSSPLPDRSALTGPVPIHPPPSSPSGIFLASNDYAGNPGAGLNVTLASPGPLVLHSTDGLARDNGLGIRAAGDGLELDLTNATFTGNDVGLLTEDGARAHLDHASFEHNDRWDLHATGGPSQVQWTGSRVEPSCVHIEGHDGYGCQRGSIGGVTVLTIVLGILYSLAFLASQAARDLLTRVWLWLRLYRRIPTDEVLDNETRRMLLELVHEDPGRHLRDLAREVGSYGRTVHHLRRLEDEDFVRSQHEGRYLRFYPIDVDPDDRGPRSVRENVFAEIERDPGTYGSEVARQIDVSRQLVSYHVGRLREMGKVAVEVDGGVNRLYPAGGREVKRDSDVS